jgi:hypothetical protein
MFGYAAQNELIGQHVDHVGGLDPPPMNWSTLRYVFGSQEDQNAEEAS